MEVQRVKLGAEPNVPEVHGYLTEPFLVHHLTVSQADDTMVAGLEEFELKDLAYTVFAGACGRAAHPDLVRTVCNQLDVRPHLRWPRGLS